MKTKVVNQSDFSLDPGLQKFASPIRPAQLAFDLLNTLFTTGITAERKSFSYLPDIIYVRYLLRMNNLFVLKLNVARTLKKNSVF